ncbi:hypothetical protein NV379_17630 [Paenibacillus sp. N1-5-1-14]|uniref:hypothetical protein n=1 Tax=Paenibacillus radicibacter TaxID=2972488 RepID=UPI002158D55E|nr:hypothetical protein [Paenibacillus radicibacter]MCR8644479.1 hypothetical protein [Paenibacillus radicibacter]
MNNNNLIIISISGVSGGGKTTVVTHLNKVLANSKALYFDDYEFEGPKDFRDWIDRGADRNEWNITPLLEDMGKITCSEHAEFLLLDYPFSRLHNQLPLIDLSIFIDTPLDIAMARRILRDHSHSDTQVIMDEMRNYLSGGRRGYESMLRTIKPDSDLIIDGTLSVDTIVARILEEISKRFNE